MERDHLNLLMKTLRFAFPLLAAGAASRAATDIHSDAHGVTLTGGAYVTRVEVWSDRIVRVTRWPASAAAPQGTSLAVIAKPQDVKWRSTDVGDQVTLETLAVRVRLDRTTGAVQFLDAASEPRLAETPNGSALTPATVGGVSTWRVRQTFALATDEGIYGLGQHPDGFMNHRGTNVHLQQENRIVGVPMLVSSRGYGVLWDNPAVTDVRVGAGELETIPTAQFFDEAGRPGGLTARYYRGRNFDTLVSVRIDPQIAFKWNDTPPSGLPRDNFSVRWNGFLEAKEAGDYQLVATVDDGVRFWIDDRLIIDAWKSTDTRPQRGKMTFAAHSRHKVRMEYFQGEWSSTAYLAWELPPDPATLTWASEAGDAVDYYFILGPELDEVAAGYRGLTGSVPMFPQWTWGFWQCRERYESQQEILDVVAEYRRRGIPLDGIIQDWQYWQPGQWGSHDFDPARYPDPTAMVDAVHRANAHIAISVWSRFDLGLAHTAELMAAGALYPPVYPNVWPKGQGKWYDPFNPEGRRLYWKYLSEKLFARGFDGWWMDASEPELGGNWGEMRELTTAAGPGAKVFNAYPLMHSTGVYQGQRAESSGKRVFILTRSAYPGQQRNAAVTWSGDTHGDWEVLRQQIPAGLNFSVTGIPYWNTDIGGFFGGDPADPQYAELFTRWFQFGVFCPMFRVHGTGKPKEIWRFDEATQRILIEYIHLRYRLLPYIYSVAWKVTHEGSTMLRPLVMDFRADPKARDIPDQFLFGPALMVNPVTTPGSTKRAVYLPALSLVEGPVGNPWIDFWTGQSYAGGQTIEAAASIDKIPLFVRAGSIMPYGPEVQYAAEKPADPLELRVYRGADGNFTLYEDEGDNYDYEHGAYATIPLHWDEQGQTLTIGERQGEYPGMLSERTIRVVWVSPGHGSGLAPTETADVEVHYSGRTTSIRAAEPRAD
jgi:alpha-D-xyloside xylohydrolase